MTTIYLVEDSDEYIVLRSGSFYAFESRDDAIKKAEEIAAWRTSTKATDPVTHKITRRVKGEFLFEDTEYEIHIDYLGTITVQSLELIHKQPGA